MHVPKNCPAKYGPSNAKGRRALPMWLMLTLAIASCKSSSTNPPSTPTGGAGIGPNGGTVTSADGKVTLVIPVGALSSTQNIAIISSTDSNTCPQKVGTLYSLMPNGLQFSKPATLTLPYDTTMIGASAELVGVAYLDIDGSWYGVTGGSVDTVHRTVTVPISHFSNWSANLSFEITPASSVVLTGTSLGFEVNQVGPPANDPSGQPVKLSNPFALVAAVWKVNGTGGNATVGTLSNEGQTVLYSAPQQMPSPNLVTLSASVSTNGQNYVVPAFIHVIAKNWTLTGVDTLIYSCPSAITYIDVSGGYIDFQLDDVDYSATSYGWFPSSANGTYNEALCPSLAPLVDTWSLTRGEDMNISSITSGGFILGSNAMVLHTNARWRDLPGYDITWKVPGESPTHVAVNPGNSYEGALIFQHLSATNVWVDDHSAGAYLEHITWTLTAQ